MHAPMEHAQNQLRAALVLMLAELREDTGNAHAIALTAQVDERGAAAIDFQATDLATRELWGASL